MTLDAHQLISLIGVIVGSGVLVTLVAKYLKRFLKLKTDSVIHTMVVVIAFVASAAQYIVQIHSKLPPEILGVSATAIYGISQIVYKYAVYFGGFWAKVQAVNAGPATPTQAPAGSVGPVFASTNPVPAEYVATGDTKLPPAEFSV